MDLHAQYDKLNEYIASLSAEDKQRYRHLIEEAIDMDNRLSESYSVAKKMAEEYAASMGRLHDQVSDLGKSVADLVEKVSEVREASEMASKLQRTGPCWN